MKCKQQEREVAVQERTLKSSLHFLKEPLPYNKTEKWENIYV